MTLLAALLVGMGWGLSPSAAQEARPFVPVLLVPGWFDTASELEGLLAHLRIEGWPADRVAALTFAEPTGGNHDHAQEIADAVDSLLARTGAEQVDIVAHSMGGLATRLYLREHPGKVRRVVFMATPHRGTLSAYLAFGKGRGEMLPGSAFLDSLNAGPAVPPGLGALTVRTLLDTHIIPGSSATLPGVRDVTVCCATHAGLTWSLEAFQVVRDFLRRDGPGPGPS